MPLVYKKCVPSRKTKVLGASETVQWLVVSAFTVEGAGSFLAGKLRILQAMPWGQKITPNKQSKPKKPNVLIPTRGAGFRNRAPKTTVEALLEVGAVSLSPRALRFKVVRAVCATSRGRE